MANSLYKNTILSSLKYKEQLDYWIKNLEGDLKPIKLPKHINEKNTNTYLPEKINIKLKQEVSSKLIKMCKDSDLSIYIMILSSLSSLLYKYTGDKDILLSAPTLEGNNDGYNNMVLFRSILNNTTTFKDVVIYTRKIVLDAYNNQDYPIDMVLDTLGLDSKNINGLVNIMLSFTNIHGKQLANKLNQDIHFTCNREENEISMKVTYNSNSLDKSIIQHLINNFTQAVECLINNINEKIDKLDTLFNDERKNILSKFTSEKDCNNKYKTIHEMFEHQVSKTPDSIAVKYENQEYTFKELNLRVNKLARYLQDRDVSSDSIVAIMFERSLDMIVGIMGVIKSGAAYMPIDPDYPSNRIEYMLEDSRTKLVLSHRSFLDRIQFSGEKINLEEKQIWKYEDSNIHIKTNSNNLAYVIYTSGSTGNPKGVMIENHNVINLVYGLKKSIYDRYSEGLNISMLSPYVFDASIKQIFPSLLLGHTLHIIADKIRLNREALIDYYSKNTIQVADGTPTHLNMLIDDTESGFNNLSIKHFVIGGEELTKQFVRKLLEGFSGEKPLITNVYGPTECCDVSTLNTITYKDVQSCSNISIGKPLPNVNIYILNKVQDTALVGMPGELCIAGEGVARGYLNREDLTSEKFVNNPLNSKEIIYRTGDLARWLPDGSIEFLGRIDYQVKIRGYRIELGEIENKLLAHESIKGAVVTVKEDNKGQKYLCAFVITDNKLKEENQLNISDIREYLLKKMPDYMIPSYFIQLDKLPITANGKVDRKVLEDNNKYPNVDIRTSSSANYEAPRNNTEEKLVEIWQEVLEIQNIGINDNFFELGGHSLKATTVVTKIHKELNAEVPLNKIFKAPTIKSLSEYIKTSKENKHCKIQSAQAIYCDSEQSQYYYASSAQKRMYTLQQFDIDSTSYNMPGILEIKGKLDIEKIEQAFKVLINRHESLRTSVELRDGEIVQKIKKQVDFNIDNINISNYDVEKEKELISTDISKFIRAFDLSKAPLLRVGLINVKSDKYILMLDLHHIISDGVSMNILIREFAQVYEGQELEELKVQYKDYAVWQTEYFKSQNIKKQEKYWLDLFKEENTQEKIPVLNIPTDYPRPSVQSFEGNRLDFVISKQTTTNLKQFLKDTGNEDGATTLYMLLLATFNILLSKYSGQEDIVIGSPVAGRPHTDLENIIGMFVNTLAMRNYPKADKTFKGFLSEVKENCMKAYENQDYQFEELIDKLDITRDLSRNPLFDFIFAMQNMDMEELRLNDLLIKTYAKHNSIAKLDITVIAVEEDNEISLGIQYCTKLFKQSTIKRLFRHYKNILNQVIDNPNIKLKDIALATEEEKQQILIEFNNTNTDYPKDKTIQQLFEEQVEKNPDNIAIAYGDKYLSYKQLNKKANQLAAILINKGLVNKEPNRENIVAIMVERSFEMIIGILGILKAGATYLPIDTQYPKERIKFMLKECNTEVLLTQARLVDNVDSDVDVITIDNMDLSVSSTKQVSNVEINKHNILPAYIMYTSGSTGKPKGVIVEHKNVVRLVKNTNYITFKEHDRILQTGAIVFDACTFEIWGALLNGLQLHLADTDTILDAVKLVKTIKDNKITILWLTSSLFNRLVQQDIEIFAGLRYLLVGGDVLAPQNINKVYEEYPSIKIINGYGPTENTTFSTCFTIDKAYQHNIPIGKPISNSKAYIVDKQNKLLPIGVAGELCVSGDGLAKGYQNRSDLTSYKFITTTEIGEKMYKTGDLARWLPDGNIEFLGRIDNQVKIRGYRIELGEIENRLLSHKIIKEAIVVAKEEKNNTRDNVHGKYICAYFVSKDNEVGSKQLIVSKLREYLSKDLPDYMIPAYFVHLDKMPLTINGKVDKSKLPEPNANMEEVEYQPPSSELEKILVDIFEEALEVENIGINHSFFELGGHSLKAIKVANLIKEEVRVDIKLQDIIRNATVSELAVLIEANKISKKIDIKKAPEQDYYELSYNQKRLLLLHEINPEGTEYNMFGYMKINHSLEINVVNRSFEYLANRHESLRTCIKKVNSNYVQSITENCQLNIGFVDITNMEIDKRIEALNNIYKQVKKHKFQLEEAPLMAVKIVKIHKEEYELVYVMHHIISDGWSMELLRKEFSTVYEAFSKGNTPNLKPINLQYKDFAYWQNKEISEAGQMLNAREFWRKQLSGGVGELDLHVKNTSVAEGSNKGSSYSVVIEENITHKLKQLALEQKTTLFSVLISAFYTYFSEFTQQEDISFGIAGSGRDNAGLEDVIGFFINTVILRNKIDMEDKYIDFLENVSNIILDSLQYQEYPLELVIEELNIKYPKINIFINMLNMGDTNKQSIKTKDYRISSDIPDVKFDMEFYLIEYMDGIDVVCTYKKDYFEIEIIEYMLSEFSNLLTLITEDKTKTLEEYFE